MPKPLRIGIVVVLLAIAGTVIWYVAIRTPPEPAGIIAVSGRIEGDDAVNGRGQASFAVTEE